MGSITIPARTLSARAQPYPVGPYALPSGPYEFVLHVVGSQAEGGTFDIAIEAVDDAGEWDAVGAVYGATFGEDGTFDATWGFYLGSPEEPQPDTLRWANRAQVRARIWVHDEALATSSGGTLGIT